MSPHAPWPKAPGACKAAFSASLLAACLLLSACSQAPRTPDWRLDARDSLERATQAYLSGHDAVASSEFGRARTALSAAAQPQLMAKAELLRCAAQVASLEGLATPEQGPAACPAFEHWRSDSGTELQAYADWLQGRLGAALLERLPPDQRSAAAAGQDAARREAAVRAIQDPLSRLLAAAVALREGVAPPGLVSVAIDTASEQGWRRPLLAWLTFQFKRARQAGDGAAAATLQRRIELLTDSGGSAARR